MIIITLITAKQKQNFKLNYIFFDEPLCRLLASPILPVPPSSISAFTVLFQICYLSSLLLSTAPSLTQARLWESGGWG